jgi:hypothetical protein
VSCEIDDVELELKEKGKFARGDEVASHGLRGEGANRSRVTGNDAGTCVLQAGATHTLPNENHNFRRTRESY